MIFSSDAPDAKPLSSASVPPPVTPSLNPKPKKRGRLSLITSFLTSSAPSVPHTPPKAKSSTPSLQKSTKKQYAIDAGQSGLISAFTCPTCNYTYTPSDLVDSASHDRHHDEKESGVKLPKRAADPVGGRVWRARGPVSRIKEIVDEEMGFVDPSTHGGLKVYLTVVGGRTVGYLSVEALSTAYRAVDGGRSKVEESGFQLGVKQIWIHKDHRSKGYARELLDEARGDFIYGEVVPKSKVAFSSPTDDGMLLATRYLGTVYVYDVC